MSCVEQSKGRYVSKTRKSPPYQAQECKNKAKVGRDGTMWISLPDKNLKYTWKSFGGAAHKKAIDKAAGYETPPKGNGNGDGGEYTGAGLGEEYTLSEKSNGKKSNGKKSNGKKSNGKRMYSGVCPRGQYWGSKKGKCRGLEGLTVVELRQKAKDRGLKGYSGKNKAALVTMLQKKNGKKPASAKKTSAKKTSAKKTSAKKTSAKKTSAKKPASAQARKAAGYTKKKGATGQVLYYKNGKRVAKKNVPVKYQ